MKIRKTGVLSQINPEMKTNNILLIKINFGHLQNAVDCSKVLLSEKLIACANITECRSIYNWENVLTDEDELVLSVKSTINLKDKLILRIKELHTYELPAIFISESEVNQEYFEWVLNCCNI